MEKYRANKHIFLENVLTCSVFVFISRSKHTFRASGLRCLVYLVYSKSNSNSLIEKGRKQREANSLEYEKVITINFPYFSGLRA